MTSPDTPSITLIHPTRTPKSKPVKRRPKPKMFTEKELEAIGAAVWAALEEDTDNLHERFYPYEDAPITKEQLLDKLYSAKKKLDKLGVFMG